MVLERVLLPGPSAGIACFEVSLVFLGRPAFFLSPLASSVPFSALLFFFASVFCLLVVGSLGCSVAGCCSFATASSCSRLLPALGFSALSSAEGSFLSAAADSVDSCSGALISSAGLDSFSGFALSPSVDSLLPLDWFNTSGASVFFSSDAPLAVSGRKRVSSSQRRTPPPCIVMRETGSHANGAGFG